MPHSRIQVELGFYLQAGTCQILNFAQNPRQSQGAQGTELNWRGDTAQKKCILGGGTPHKFSEQCANMGGTPHIKTGSGGHRTLIGVGTPHSIERKS